MIIGPLSTKVANNHFDHRRSYDFLWRVHFFLEKKLTTFLVVAHKTQAETTKLTAPTLQIFLAHQKYALKFDFLLCLWVHLTTFRYKLRPIIFSSALGDARAPSAPLATPMTMNGRRHSSQTADRPNTAAVAISWRAVDAVTTSSGHQTVK